MLPVQRNYQNSVYITAEQEAHSGNALANDG
jgi:hypothetical protein